MRDVIARQHQSLMLNIQVTGEYRHTKLRFIGSENVKETKGERMYMIQSEEGYVFIG